ncbi:MAG: Disaggr assoc protein, partial [Euryarchaeota archaeon]|nr:Disaggr assoc protein [Euryarchaeota archaeon]
MKCLVESQSNMELIRNRCTRYEIKEISYLGVVMLAAMMRVDEVLGNPVINYLPETHTFVLENNCLYNNYAGNYF